MTSPLDHGSVDPSPPEPAPPEQGRPPPARRSGADRRAATIARMRREVAASAGRLDAVAATLARRTAPLLEAIGRLHRDLARRLSRDRREAMLAGDARPAATMPLLGLFVGLAVLAVGFAGIHWARAPRPEPAAVAAPSLPLAAPTPAAERVPPVSNERRIAAGRLSGLRTAPIAPLDPTAPSATGFETVFTVAPPYETIDSALFDTVDRRFRLARILPVGREQVCLGDQGRRFACGLQARAALQNTIARRNVECRRLFLPTTTIADEPVPVDCTVGDVDLAEHLVRLGHAFAGPLAGEDLRAVQADARARRVGVWSADVAPPERDPALDDARAIPFLAGRIAATPPPAALIRVDEPATATPPIDLRPAATPRPEPSRQPPVAAKPARRPPPAGPANP